MNEPNLNQILNDTTTVPPAPYTHNGERYAFDACYPKTGDFIKVFTALDQEELQRYRELPVSQDVVLIIDTKEICEPTMRFRDLPADLCEAAIQFNAHIRHGDNIYTPFTTLRVLEARRRQDALQT